MAMQWTGRQLDSITKDTSTISYNYNPNGFRTFKIVNGVETNYFVEEDGTILTQQCGDEILNFLYDSDGTRIGFMKGTDTYYYCYDAQGNVTGIVDKNFNSVVQYNYDAWGKLLSTEGTLASTIGQLNPFRYRGYYYDNETGFYYLQSRYYDPTTYRFINADSIIDGGAGFTGLNLYAYCGNNPVMFQDSSGKIPLSIAMAGQAAIDSYNRGMAKNNLDNANLCSYAILYSEVLVVNDKLMSFEVELSQNSNLKLIFSKLAYKRNKLK